MPFDIGGPAPHAREAIQRVQGIDLTINPARGLTLSANYAYNYVYIPPTINPFPAFQTGIGTVVSTTPIGIYQAWTPEHAASGAIDSTLPFKGFTLRAHIDGN